LFGTWQGNKLSAGGFSAQRSGGETPVEGGGKFDQVQKPNLLRARGGTFPSVSDLCIFAAMSHANFGVPEVCGCCSPFNILLIACYQSNNNYKLPLSLPQSVQRQNPKLSRNPAKGRCSEACLGGKTNWKSK